MIEIILQMIELEEKNRELDRKLTCKSILLEEAEKELVHVGGKLVGASMSKDAARSINRMLQTALKEARKTSVERRKRADQLEAENQELWQKFEVVRQQRNQQNRQNIQLAVDMAKRDEENESLHRNLNARGKEIASLHRELVKYRALELSNNNKQDESSKHVAKIAEYSNIIDNLDTKLGTLEVDHAKMCDEYTRIMQYNARLEAALSLKG